LKISNLIFMVLALVLITSLASIWLVPSVQDFMAANTMWNGLRDFSDQFGAKSIDSLGSLPDQPGKEVLVAIPYTLYSTTDLSRLKQFVENGGTLLVADDFGYGNGILAYIGLEARFDGSILLDPLFCYKNENLPRITDFSSKVKESGVDAVVFNHGTALSYVSDTQTLAWSSSASFLDANQNGVWDIGEAKGPFAVAAEFSLGKGSVELVSDPSLIINSMVEKNDNLKFVQYLMGRNGTPGSILVDRSHLDKTPLDVSKTRLISAREVLSGPYVLLGITALVFVVVTRYTFRRGKTVE
jgi:hypothetical protein